jgi:hypothetical protein
VQRLANRLSDITPEDASEKPRPENQAKDYDALYRCLHSAVISNMRSAVPWLGSNPHNRALSLRLRAHVIRMLESRRSASYYKDMTAWLVDSSECSSILRGSPQGEPHDVIYQNIQ